MAMSFETLHDALRSGLPVLWTLADGATVELRRTCCAFQHPDSLETSHVGAHGYKPYWFRVDGGAWINTGGRPSEFSLLRNAPVYGALAANAAEWVEAMGLRV